MSKEDRDKRLGTSNLSFGKQMDCLKKMDDDTKRKEVVAITELDKICQVVELDTSSSACHRLCMSIGVEN